MDTGNIRIRIDYEDNIDVALNINVDISIENALMEHCQLHGIVFNDVDFLYKFGKIRRETPKDLKMKENDVVQILKAAITAKFMCYDDYSRVNIQFEIKRSLLEVGKTYAGLVLKDYDNMRFMFNGVLINKSDTAETLQMKEDDIVEVEPIIANINLKFVEPNDLSAQKTLGLKIHHSLCKVMKQYAAIVEKDFDDMRFMFNGRRLREFATPERLKMKENDIIEVLPEIESINVKLRQDGFEMDFRIMFLAQMKELKEEYAEQVGISVASLRFSFNRRHVRDVDTPKRIGIEENDVIIVNEQRQD